MKALAIAAMLTLSIGGTAGANAMEISRGQCESIRRDIIARTQALLYYQKAIRQMQIVAMDMVLMRDFVEADGVSGRQLAARLTKDIAAISAALKEALSRDGLTPNDLTFVKVCGPPPGKKRA